MGSTCVTTNYGAVKNRPQAAQGPLIDTRPFFSGSDLFSLGIAAGLALVVFSMVSTRRVKSAWRYAKRVHPYAFKSKRYKKRARRKLSRKARQIRGERASLARLQARLDAL